MAKDNQRGATDIDESSDSMHAADEPTAVWDMETLRKAGLSELVDNKPLSEPPTGPATPADGLATRPSIIVDDVSVTYRTSLDSSPTLMKS